MDSSVIGLFQYAQSRVTDQDIIDFCPGDPGYLRYVKLWTQIKHSGNIQKETDFELSEVIGLTGWAEAEKRKNPERFKNFRRFTSTVGIALLHNGNDSEYVHSANYLALALVKDRDPTSKRQLTLIRAVIDSTRVVLSTTNLDRDYPFFTFASMILAQQARDWEASEMAATLLIKDEGFVRSNSDYICGFIQDDRFLLGLSVYDQLHNDWISLAKSLKNPNKHEDTQLVIDAITQI